MIVTVCQLAQQTGLLAGKTFTCGQLLFMSESPLKEGQALDAFTSDWAHGFRWSSISARMQKYAFSIDYVSKEEEIMVRGRHVTKENHCMRATMISRKTTLDMM
jgi:hypothetical protein